MRRLAALDDREKSTRPVLEGLGAVQAGPRLYFSERAGTRGFWVWGKLVLAAGPPGSWQRAPLLALYAAFLTLMIFTLVPASLALQALLRPFMAQRLSRIKTEF